MKKNALEKLPQKLFSKIRLVSGEKYLVGRFRRSGAAGWLTMFFHCRSLYGNDSMRGASKGSRMDWGEISE